MGSAGRTKGRTCKQKQSLWLVVWSSFPLGSFQVRTSVIFVTTVAGGEWWFPVTSCSFQWTLISTVYRLKGLYAYLSVFWNVISVLLWGPPEIIENFVGCYLLKHLAAMLWIRIQIVGFLFVPYFNYGSKSTQLKIWKKTRCRNKNGSSCRFKP